MTTNAYQHLIGGKPIPRADPPAEGKRDQGGRETGSRREVAMPEHKFQNCSHLFYGWSTSTKCPDCGGKLVRVEGEKWGEKP